MANDSPVQELAQENKSGSRNVLAMLLITVIVISMIASYIIYFFHMA